MNSSSDSPLVLSSFSLPFVRSLTPLSFSPVSLPPCPLRSFECFLLPLSFVNKTSSTRFLDWTSSFPYSDLFSLHFQLRNENLTGFICFSPSSSSAFPSFLLTSDFPHFNQLFNEFDPIENAEIPANQSINLILVLTYKSKSLVSLQFPLDLTFVEKFSPSSSVLSSLVVRLLCDFSPSTFDCSSSFHLSFPSCLPGLSYFRSLKFQNSCQHAIPLNFRIDGKYKKMIKQQSIIRLMDENGELTRKSNGDEEEAGMEWTAELSVGKVSSFSLVVFVSPLFSCSAVSFSLQVYNDHNSANFFDFSVEISICSNRFSGLSVLDCPEQLVGFQFPEEIQRTSDSNSTSSLSSLDFGRLFLNSSTSHRVVALRNDSPFNIICKLNFNKQNNSLSLVNDQSGSYSDSIHFLVIPEFQRLSDPNSIVKLNQLISIISSSNVQQMITNYRTETLLLVPNELKHLSIIYIPAASQSLDNDLQLLDQLTGELPVQDDPTCSELVTQSSSSIEREELLQRRFTLTSDWLSNNSELLRLRLLSFLLSFDCQIIKEIDKQEDEKFPDYLSTQFSVSLPALSHVCTSIVTVLPAYVDIGDISIGTKRKVTLRLTNHSELPTEMQILVQSKCCRFKSDRVFIPPSSSRSPNLNFTDIRFSFIPRSLNPHYHKQIAFVNLNNPSNPVYVNVRASVLDQQVVLRHSHYYSLQIPKQIHIKQLTSYFDSPPSTDSSFPFSFSNFRSLDEFFGRADCKSAIDSLYSINIPLLDESSSELPLTYLLEFGGIIVNNPVCKCFQFRNLTNSPLKVRMFTNCLAPHLNVSLFRFHHSKSENFPSSALLRRFFLDCNLLRFFNSYEGLSEISQRSLVQHEIQRRKDLQSLLTNQSLEPIDQSPMEVAPLDIVTIYCLCTASSNQRSLKSARVIKPLAAEIHFELVDLPGGEFLPIRSLPFRGSIGRSVVEAAQKNFNFGHLSSMEKHEKTLLLNNIASVPAFYELRKSGSINSADLLFNDSTVGLILPLQTREISFVFQPSLAGHFSEPILVANVEDQNNQQQILVKAYLRKPVHFWIKDLRLDFGPISVDQTQNSTNSCQDIVIKNISLKARQFKCEIRKIHLIQSKLLAPTEESIPMTEGEKKNQSNKKENHISQKNLYESNLLKTAELGVSNSSDAFAFASNSSLPPPPRAPPLLRFPVRPSVSFSAETSNSPASGVAFNIQELQEEEELLQRKLKIAERKKKKEKIEKIQSRLKEIRDLHGSAGQTNESAGNSQNNNTTRSSNELIFSLDPNYVVNLRCSIDVCLESLTSLHLLPSGLMEIWRGEIAIYETKNKEIVKIVEFYAELCKDQATVERFQVEATMKGGSANMITEALQHCQTEANPVNESNTHDSIHSSSALSTRHSDAQRRSSLDLGLPSFSSLIQPRLIKSFSSAGSENFITDDWINDFTLSESKLQLATPTLPTASLFHPTVPIEFAYYNLKERRLQPFSAASSIRTFTPHLQLYSSPIDLKLAVAAISNRFDSITLDQVFVKHASELRSFFTLDSLTPNSILIDCSVLNFTLSPEFPHGWINFHVSPARALLRHHADSVDQPPNHEASDPDNRAEEWTLPNSSASHSSSSSLDFSSVSFRVPPKAGEREHHKFSVILNGRAQVRLFVTFFERSENLKPQFQQENKISVQSVVRKIEGGQERKSIPPRSLNSICSGSICFSVSSLSAPPQIIEFTVLPSVAFVPVSHRVSPLLVLPERLNLGSVVLNRSAISQDSTCSGKFILYNSTSSTQGNKSKSKFKLGNEEIKGNIHIQIGQQSRKWSESKRLPVRFHFNPEVINLAPGEKQTVAFKCWLQHPGPQTHPILVFDTTNQVSITLPVSIAAKEPQFIRLPDLDSTFTRTITWSQLDQPLAFPMRILNARAHRYALFYRTTHRLQLQCFEDEGLTLPIATNRLFNWEVNINESQESSHEQVMNGASPLLIDPHQLLNVWIRVKSVLYASPTSMHIIGLQFFVYACETVERSAILMNLPSQQLQQLLLTQLNIRLKLEIQE
jgi:hypothetical protein